MSKGRYLGLGFLILVDILIYALVLTQFLGLAQREASLGYGRTATVMRAVPAVAIPGIVAVAAALTYWRSGQKVHPSALVGAICAFVVDCLAILGVNPSRIKPSRRGPTG